MRAQLQEQIGLLMGFCAGVTATIVIVRVYLRIQWPLFRAESRDNFEVISRGPYIMQRVHTRDHIGEQHSVNVSGHAV